MDKLKIGILIDGKIVPAWVYAMVEQIIKSDHSIISLVIENKIIPEKRSLFTKLKNSYQFLLFKQYVLLDKLFFKSHPDAFELVDISKLIEAVPILYVKPDVTRFSDRFTAEDLLLINNHQLDVIVRIGFKILRGNILHAAKYGIWSFHHGDNKINRGGPPGVWEVLQDLPETGVVLQVLTEKLDGGIVIERSYAKTDKISIYRSNNTTYWKSLSMVPRNLKKLHRLGELKFMDTINHNNTDPDFYYNKLFTTPANLVFGKLILKKLGQVLRENWSELFFIKQWILLYHFSGTGKLGQSFLQFKKILPPKDRFWADPFIVFKNDLYYIFFEELLYKTNKGHIAMFTMDKQGTVSKPVTVLEKAYHVSYPFVFEQGDSYFMIPETYANKRIDLYRCTQFPHQWELMHTLMDNVLAVDTTIHFYNDKYWMFCNIEKNDGASTLDELFIFYATDFTSSNWQPHAKNPVVSDVKKTRPAGKIFKYKDEYYRPSQDCSRHYGRGMHIGKITCLTETEYEEESIQFMYSNWDKRLSSMHTLSWEGNLTMIDAQYKRWKY